MGLLKEFKEFALKGNVMDMAVGVIIGGAFGKIVSSLVDDIIMPLVGGLIGDTKFNELNILIKEGSEGVDPVTWNYGAFIQNCVDFLIVALCIFFMVKAINKLTAKKEEAPAPEAPAEPSAEEKLLAEIRDLLRDKK